MEAEYLVSMFTEFWVGQLKAPHCPAAEGSGSTTSNSPADSSAGAEALLSGAEAEGAAGNGSCEAGEPSDLISLMSQQGDDMGPGAADDIAGDASSTEPANQGSCSAALKCSQEDFCTESRSLGLGL